MKINGGLLAAAAFASMLGACATTGTSVSSSGTAYKDLAKSQQWWCDRFASSCTCSIDGMKTTCSLVYACVNSGNCSK